MIHHSAVSLDYLQELLDQGKSAGIGPMEKDLPGPWPLLIQRHQLRSWRSLGYTYAPPCDNVTPDGRCAGHEKGEPQP